jgi:hypothetical protein
MNRTRYPRVISPYANVSMKNSMKNGDLGRKPREMMNDHSEYLARPIF